ncbi:MAG TPA: MlaA family lipoprotein [Caulobacteraceae bacterium]
MPPRTPLLLAGLGAAALAGAAHAQTPGDPFEKMNRRFYAQSEVANRRIFTPLGRVYRALTPGPIGEGLHNFFTYLSEPVVIANDILQGRPSRAGNDIARLVTNSVFAGFVDLAKGEGLPHQDNDFGVTLGRWGVGPGPYLYLPLLGPSTVRDAIGNGADAAMGPLNYVRFPGRLTLQVTTTLVGGIDLQSRTAGELEALTSGAADPYATLRSVYLQSREAAIRGESAAPILPPIDEPDASPEAGAPQADGTTPADPSPASQAAPAPQAAPEPTPGPSASAAPPSGPARAAMRLAAADDGPIATAQPCDREPAATALAMAD